MNGMQVYIKVHPSVREFILCTNGSINIVPKKNDWIWLLLKQNLTTAPETYKTIPDDELHTSYISIALLDASGSKVFVKNKTSGKSEIYMNTLFRFHLTEHGQNVIAKHLRTQFKQCYHNFVQGALAVSPDLEQKQVIIEFCKLYNISFNHITEEMLYKSWQRSDQKIAIQDRISNNRIKEKSRCPIIF